MIAYRQWSFIEFLFSGKVYLGSPNNSNFSTQASALLLVLHPFSFNKNLGHKYSNQVINKEKISFFSKFETEYPLDYH